MSDLFERIRSIQRRPRWKRYARAPYTWWQYYTIARRVMERRWAASTAWMLTRATLRDPKPLEAP